MHSHFGTKIIYQFNNLVLEELDDEELKTSDNMIDLFLYAAKCASLSEHEHQKYKYLRTLTELLSERGWDKNEKRELLLFIMRVINLKDEILQQQYWEYRQEIDKEGKLMYEPFLKRIEEKMAEKRGIGISSEIIRALKKNETVEIIAERYQLPIEDVKQIQSALL